MIGSTRPIARLAIIALVCALTIGLLTTPAIAGDNVAIYDIEAEDTDVESGETVTVTVHFSTHGGYGGEGVVQLGSTVRYDDVLTVEEVDAGSFFTDDDAEAELTIDDEDGTLSLEQERVPAGTGTTGSAAAFEITFAVDEDTSPTTAQIELDSHESILETGVQQATFAHTNDVSIAVDGGGDDSDEGDDTTDPEGVTIADDQPAADDDGDASGDESGTTTTADDDTGAETDDTEDAIPGFAVTATIAAALIVLGVRLADRRL